MTEQERYNNMSEKIKDIDIEIAFLDEELSELIDYRAWLWGERDNLNIGDAND